MSEHKCECDVCYFSRQVNEQIQKLEDPDAQNFFMNLYDMFIHSEMDKDYYKAIVQNKWPDAGRIIAKYHDYHDVEVNEHRRTGYSEKHDAYYYEDTGDWVEPKCSDLTCEFCNDRPPKHVDQ